MAALIPVNRERATTGGCPYIRNRKRQTEAEITVDLSSGIPTANAGADQTVDEKEIVTLDGSASFDADGTVVSYQWTQTGEPLVTLSDPASPTPTFIAPEVDSNEVYLTFELTVTDDDN